MIILILGFLVGLAQDNGVNKIWEMSYLNGNIHTGSGEGL